MPAHSYYISRNYKSKFNAAGKAKIDCEYALKSLGFSNLGFKQSTIPNSALGTLKNSIGITLALLKLPFGATLCTQHPNNKFRAYILKIARLKKCKIITIVHDINGLQGRPQILEKELKKILASDVIIVHNPAMKEWFLKQNTKIPIVVLGIFDYVSDLKPIQNKDIINDLEVLNPQEGKTTKYPIVYAGGFGDSKNAYIYDLDEMEVTQFSMNLYGKGFNAQNIKTKEEDSILNYLGSVPSDQVAHKIKGAFGLVWDGHSLDTCIGKYGAYLKINNPHKTSLYILSGLPIIIWEEAALANFVKEKQIGICIGSLKELDVRLKDLTTDQYNSMKNNVAELQTKVMQGGFVKEAVMKALKQLN